MAGVEVQLRDDGCLVLRLDNPPARNALNLAMMTQLAQALAEAADDPQVRVVMLRGAGRDFCSGRDISDMGDAETLTDADLRRDLQPLRRLALAFQQSPKPTLCVVTGYALGLGAALVALSDIAIADHDARLGFPEARIGLPASLTAVSLMSAVAPKAALPLLFTGMIIDGREAEAMRLVTKSYEAEAIDAAADDWIMRLSRSSPTALALTKALVRTSAGAPFAAQLDMAIDTAVAGFRTPDAVAGRARFLNKDNNS